jgi:uncharacterized damage-inducible protein DinB
MTIAQSMLGEFDHELATTQKVLGRVPQELFDYKPHEKSMSMGELAHHVAMIYAWGQITCDLDVFEFDGQSPVAPKTIAEVVTLLDSNSGAFRTSLAKLSDEQMMTVWQMKVPGKEAPLMAMPRIAVLRGMIFNHLVHHRGQLSVYLRLNDVPLPAMYGPSADEGRPA